MCSMYGFSMNSVSLGLNLIESWFVRLVFGECNSLQTQPLANTPDLRVEQAASCSPTAFLILMKKIIELVRKSQCCFRFTFRQQLACSRSLSPFLLPSLHKIIVFQEKKTNSPSFARPKSHFSCFHRLLSKRENGCCVCVCVWTSLPTCCKMAFDYQLSTHRSKTNQRDSAFDCNSLSFGRQSWRKIRSVDSFLLFLSLSLLCVVLVTSFLDKVCCGLIKNLLLVSPLSDDSTMASWSTPFSSSPFICCPFSQCLFRECVGFQVRVCFF